jgi:hypothetical protein
MTSLTVITHIYNESYLLPFWLLFHKNIFDNGIIIDYFSTDASPKIISTICPNWIIIRTKNYNRNYTPNYELSRVDYELIDIEKRIQGYKMFLNITEFLFINEDINIFKKKLFNDIYKIDKIYSVTNNIKKHIYPKNIRELFECIDYIGILDCDLKRGNKYLHCKNTLDYYPRRKDIKNTDAIHILNNTFIIHVRDLFINKNMFNRRLQIKNNIPDIDKNSKINYHHIIDMFGIFQLNKKLIQKLDSINNKNYLFLKNYFTNFKTTIYNQELYFNSKYTYNDEIIINNDINLLKNTNYDNNGYLTLQFVKCKKFLLSYLKKKVKSLIKRDINLEKYHEEVNDIEHKNILSSMPYKKKENIVLVTLCNNLEKTISKKLKIPLKIYNNEIFIRINRPKNTTYDDYVPLHRDVYNTSFKNSLNVCIPIISNEELLPIMIGEGSHKINENELMISKDEIYLDLGDLKYKTDIIVSSKNPINMVNPVIKENHILIYSSYLIREYPRNFDTNKTMIFLEFRLIKSNK